MIDVENLNTDELTALIQKAKAELDAKQKGKRKEVIAQIKELAASIGVTVEIVEEGKKEKGTKSSVVAKYHNPNNPSQTWTGRGLAPSWAKALLESGMKKEDLLIPA